MHTMVLGDVDQALAWTELSECAPDAGEILIAVSASDVCRTNLHVIDGEIANPRFPIIPGHEIVGRIEKIGSGVDRLRLGERVGIAWLGRSAQLEPLTSRLDAKRFMVGSIGLNFSEVNLPR